jgi:hypothetical protein
MAFDAERGNKERNLEGFQNLQDFLSHLEKEDIFYPLSTFFLYLKYMMPPIDFFSLLYHYTP